MEYRDDPSEGEASPSIERLGNRIKELRSDRGWSLRQLGRRTGISHTHVAQIERGEVKEPSVLKVMAIAATFGVSVDDLLGEGKSEEAAKGVRQSSTGETRRTLTTIQADLESLAELSPESLTIIEQVVSALDEKARRDKTKRKRLRPGMY